MKEVDCLDELVIGRIYKFIYRDLVAYRRITGIESRYNKLHIIFDVLFESNGISGNRVNSIVRRKSLTELPILMKVYELTRDEYLLEIL